MITLVPSARRPIVIVDASADNVTVQFDETKFSTSFVGVKRSDLSGHSVTLKNSDASVITTLDPGQSVIVGPGGSGLWKVIADLGGTVTSVNGQTGVVVLDAGDVGADPTGSAATAEANANTYTDGEMAALTATLGTAAYEDVGTSGHTIPFNDGNNVFSGSVEVTGSWFVTGLTPTLEFHETDSGNPQFAMFSNAGSIIFSADVGNTASNTAYAFLMDGTSRFVIAPTAIRPTTDDGLALGSTSQRWSDLFLASGGVINWASGNATLTHSTGLISSNVPVSLGTSNALTAGSVEVGHATDSTIARSSAGTLTVEGNELYRAGGTDVPVADGGTGRSTHTAYMPICGGTTTTGAQQSVATGTAGQLLSYVSSSALPTFIDPITASTGTGTIGADYLFTTAVGVFSGSGMTVTLPSAGKYLIVCVASAQQQPATGTLHAIEGKIRNTTDSTDITTPVVLTFDPAGAISVGTVTIFAVVTVAASKAIELYVDRINGTTWTDSRVRSSGSSITYVKIGN